MSVIGALGAFFSFRWARSPAARTQAWEKRVHAGMRAFQEGRPEEAEIEYRAALKEAEGFAAGDPRLTVSLDSLAGLYRLQGKHREARPLCLRALAAKEKSRGAAHPSVASTLEDLAEISWALGNREEASAYRSRALAILERAIGPDFPELAESLGKAEIFKRGEPDRRDEHHQGAGHDRSSDGGDP